MSTSSSDIRIIEDDDEGTTEQNGNDRDTEFGIDLCELRTVFDKATAETLAGLSRFPKYRAAFCYRDALNPAARHEEVRQRLLSVASIVNWRPSRYDTDQGVYNYKLRDKVKLNQHGEVMHIGEGFIKIDPKCKKSLQRNPDKVIVYMKVISGYANVTVGQQDCSRERDEIIRIRPKDQYSISNDSETQTLLLVYKLIKVH